MRIHTDILRVVSSAIHAFLKKCKDVRTVSKSRAAARIRHDARMAGRWAIEKLPLGADAKVLLKSGLIDVFGRALGLRRFTGIPEPLIYIGKQAVSIGDERYRDLAASARGRPLNVPVRSVSIIIPVYNQLAFTLDCLTAVLKNTSEIEYEIIVVDDGSSDETQATLSARTGITYIRNAKNLGFIGSCSAGAERACKTYLCFLNNDTEVLPFWLSALVNTFELHENVGLAGSKLVYPSGKLQEAGGLIWNDGSGWNWGRLKSPMDPHFCYARKADYCSGASILVPRILFNSLGGFDPIYTPAYYEDTDLAFKIRSLGLATIYQPLSQVVHHEGVTSGVDISAGAKKHQVANAPKFAQRWSPVLAHQGEPGEAADLICDRGTIGRILVLDQITPEPDRDAGSVVALELMRAFRDLGYKVTFVPCSNFRWIPPYTDTLSALGIESVLFPAVRSLRQHLRRYGHTYSAVLLFRPQTHDSYKEHLKKYAPQARLIYCCCDLHFLRNERFQQLTKGIGAAELEENISSRKKELDLIASVDVSIVHSAVEKSILNELLPSTNVVVFPWTYEVRGEGPAFSERHNLIFLGGYGHPPNQDAAKHFVDDIWTILETRLPEQCRFTAAGSNPTRAVLELAGDRVDVPGFVEDLGSLLFSHRVMVVPLRYGAGVKGKLIAGLAHGLPVVTTSIGAEGLGLVNDQHVLIADTPDEFATAVERLYGDEELWHRLRREGLNWVASTTSRANGLKVAEQMLNLVGLAATPAASFAAQRARPGDATAFGSPAVLNDPGSLIGAGEGMFSTEGKADHVVVPDMVPHAELVRPVEEMTSFLNSTVSARRIVILADATDEQALKRIAEKCKTGLPPAAETVIAFVPPRLCAAMGGYTMLAPFANRAIAAFAAPSHDTWGPEFQFENRNCAWQADTSQTLFPSVTMLRIGPVLDHSSLDHSSNI